VSDPLHTPRFRRPCESRCHSSRTSRLSLVDIRYRHAFTADEYWWLVTQIPWRFHSEASRTAVSQLPSI